MWDVPHPHHSEWGSHLLLLPLLLLELHLLQLVHRHCARPSGHGVFREEARGALGGHQRDGDHSHPAEARAPGHELTRGGVHGLVTAAGGGGPAGEESTRGLRRAGVGGVLLLLVVVVVAGPGSKSAMFCFVG